MWIRRLINEFRLFVYGMRQALAEKTITALEEEYIELEIAFLLTLLGPLVGVKTLTPLLSLDLLEHVTSNEIKLLESRSFRSEDVLADVMAALGEYG